MSNRLWVKRKQGRDRGLRWEVSDVRWKTSVGLVIVGWNPCLTEGTQIPAMPCGWQMAFLVNRKIIN